MLQVYDRDDVFAHITRVGQRLKGGLLKVAQEAGQQISVTGPVTMPTVLFNNDADYTKLLAFAHNASFLGAIFHPAVNWNLSLAHKNADIDEASAIAAEAFRMTPQD